MSKQINNVDFWVDELTKDTNPDHFNFHENFIRYMDAEKISSFGNWMFNNGYNVGLYNLQTKVNSYCVPQWISVKDRLPEKYKEVLVYSAKYGVQEDWITDTPYYWHNYGELVTHWMPKPMLEPPKE